VKTGSVPALVKSDGSRVSGHYSDVPSMLGTLPSISYHLKFEYHRFGAETDMSSKKSKGPTK
jgi:hypothetical protein